MEKAEVNPMASQGQMMEQMKGNMTMMVPNMVMMGWISYFFSGFVLGKTAPAHPMPVLLSWMLAPGHYVKARQGQNTRMP